MALLVSCPCCGSSSLAHVQRALVTYEVKSFDRGVDGKVFGAEFVGRENVDWETAENVDKPWVCLMCSADLATEQLIVIELGTPVTEHHSELRH